MRKFIILIFWTVVTSCKLIHAQTLPDYLPKDDLIGWWPFNGNANDESGNGNDGLVNGPVLSPDRFGNSINAYLFNGINNEIIIPNSFLTEIDSLFSVSIWFKADDNTDHQSLFLRQSLNGSRTWLMLYDNFNFIRCYNDNGNYTSATIPYSIYGGWHHLVAVYDRNKIITYVDGNLIVQQSLPTSFTWYGENVIIGGTSGTGIGNYPFLGSIDDIGIWNRALTEQEILKLYESFSGSVTDIDGNVYSTIKIGNQEWMASDLRTSRYANGDSIINGQNLGIWFSSAGSKNGSYCILNGDKSYADQRGKIYNGYTLYDARNVCPTGWRVPTDSDFIILETVIGMPSNELYKIGERGNIPQIGVKLKSKGILQFGTGLWDLSGTSAGSDIYGWNGYPHGARLAGGDFCCDNGSVGYLYKDSLNTGVGRRELSFNVNGIIRYGEPMANGHQIRCIKEKSASLGSLDCSGFELFGTLADGVQSSGVSIILPYQQGNGGFYPEQTFSSTGVFGLTASLSSGTLAEGAGNLTLQITGIPQGTGTANFEILIGGVSCRLELEVLNSPSSCLPDYVPTDGLVGYWPFCGNANDESGNGNDGTVNGAVLTEDRFGNTGRAYKFDGVDDYGILNTTLPNSFSISFWFKVDSFLTYTLQGPNFIGSKLLSTYNNSNPFTGFEVELAGLPSNYGINGGRFWCNPTCDGVISNSPSDTINWVHVTTTFSGNKLNYFVNGSLVDSANSSLNNNSQLIYIAARGNNQRSFFLDGKLDDIGIWNRALTPEEVEQLYTGEIKKPCLPEYVPTDGLVGYWPFCGNANDESGNGNDGVVSGVTLTTDRFGNPNKAYEWKSNGDIGQYISIGAMASNFTQKSFSFSAWVLADAGQGANPRIINFGNVYPGVWSMGVNNTSRNYSGFWPPTGGFFFSNPVSSLAWNHLVYTTDATTGSTSFYVNGVLDTTFCCSSPDPTSSINGIWEFGKMKPTEIWGGKLDDIGIWNRALTEEEIEQLYTGEINKHCLPDYVPTDGLVGYWPFCGNANDESGNGNDGVVNGAQLSTDRYSNPSAAFAFKNNSDEIVLPNSYNLIDSSFSVSAWITIDNLTPSNYDATIIGQFNGLVPNDRKWLFGYRSIFNQRGISHYIFDDSGNPIQPPYSLDWNPEKNKWYHVVWKFESGNSIKTYINSNLNSDVKLSLKEFNKITNNVLIKIGNSRDIDAPLNLPWNGKIDDIGIWNRALSEDEVKNLYNGFIIPVVTTTAVSGITTDGAISGGVITYEGSLPITSRGVVWSTTPNPTISQSAKTSDGTGTGTFTSGIEGLLPSTKYYIRAYATNDVGTAYGNELTFTTRGACLPDYVPTDGLAGFWPFCGNANDESGNGNDGVYTNNQFVNDRYGNSNKALSFDGIDDYVEIPHHPSLNSWPISVSFWLKVKPGERRGKIMEKYCCANWNGWNFEIVSNTGPSGEMHFEYLRGTCLGIYQTYCSNVPYPKFDVFDNEWHHFTFTLDSTQAIVYIDGKVSFTQQWIGSPSAITNNLPLNIGRYGTGNENYFTGQLDDIGIWNRALTEEEILKLYESKNSYTCDTESIRKSNLNYGSVTDIDGNVYSTIKIGEQEWMAENLRTTRYANGDLIPEVKNSLDWEGLNFGAWCYWNNDSTYNCPFGKLYNYYAVNDQRNICPSGWHVPTPADWHILSSGLGGNGVSGGKMKSTGTIQDGDGFWNFPNNFATNESGFSAIPGGDRWPTGGFYNKDSYTVMWTKTDQGGTFRDIDNAGGDLFANGTGLNAGLTVRCIRDMSDKFCNQLIFNEKRNYGTVSDIDGNSYRTIQVGKQIWLAENLRTTKYSNGDKIPEVKGNAEWSELSTGAWCFMGNDPGWGCPYGKLYNYFTISDARNICPDGWHVPTADDWQILSNTLGGNADAGGKMKSTGTWEDNNGYWNSPNNFATNSSGLSIVPGGDRWPSGSFYNHGYYSIMWIKSDQGGTFRDIDNAGGDLFTNGTSLQSGLTIRCISNEEASSTSAMISTQPISDITSISATSGAIIISDGGSIIDNRGLVWSTTPNPTIVLPTKTSEGNGVGEFTSKITGLLPGTKYYIRAYATNDAGTAYGNELTFTTRGACLPDYVPTNGLVGYWPFCGNANDESGNGNDGVVNGATLTKDRFGNENKAYSFDGVDDYIVAINSPSLNIQGNQLSISSWVYCTIGTQGQIVSKSEVSSRKYGQYINGLFTELGFELNNSDSYNGSIQHNKWSNLITTYDGNQKKWYIDGDLVFSTSYSSNIISNNLDFYIGTFGGLIESFFNNTLDDIGIWNRALTEAEVKALYEGTTAADSPLTLSLDTITGRRGDVVVLPVRVKNFTDILSGQMSLTFDPAIVTLAGVENFGTDSITQASFNLADAASGRLSFLWTQNDNIPISLSDGDTLFAMRFKVLGRNTEFTDVRFATSPLGVEFVDASLNAVDNVVLQNGRINAFSENILSGQLRTETGQGIRSATLAASGGSIASTTSALSGQYTLTLPELTDLKVTPSKANDTVVTNGITIADVIRMQRHILGSVPLESPYKIIAADVNHSGTITGLDVVLVNALILGRLSTYPGGKLWSFVPTSHTFTNPQQPFPYPNYRSYSDFSGAANADFIGMKLGDVDNSYSPSQGRNPSADTVTIYTEDQQVPTGATEVRVPVRVSDFESISGFQFGVQWNPAVLKYKGAEKAAALSAADLGTDHTDSGHLNVAWFHPTGLWTTLSDGTAIMELIFETVGAPGSTSTVGVFDSPTTPVEIIQDDLSSASAVINSGIIALGTPSSAEDADAEGVQVSVYPNPFSDALNIEIQNAAISGSGMLSVYDEAGRQMYREEVRIEKGTSRLITGAGLPAGSYTLRLEDRDGRIIKQQKAIKIR